LIKRDQCAANYKENKCDPPTRVKRLEHFCIEWEQCMTLDPESAFRKTALTASIVSEIISNFVDPLSAKSIIVVMFFIFG
jgi:Predicted membrane protein